MIALLCAMKAEITGILKTVSIDESLKVASITPPSARSDSTYIHADIPVGLSLYRVTSTNNKEVLLVQTGPGKARSQNAARFVIDRFAVSGVVSFGFGGALAGDLAVGDLVLCSKVYCANKAEADPYLATDRSMLTKAVSVLNGSDISYSKRSFLTTEWLVKWTEEKQMLGTIFNAEVVDMESYWIGCAAIEKEVPFLAIRTISDDLGQALPPLDLLLDPRGELIWKRAAIHLMAHPKDLFGLARVAKNARRAAKTLTSFLGAFISDL